MTKNSYNGTPLSKTTLPRALEKLANLAGVHRIKIHALRHSHASLLISMGENPLIIKDRLGHEKIQTTLGTYGHLYPNSNFEVAKKLTGKLTYTPATESVADYTSNQFVSAKYSCGFSNILISSIIVGERYLDYFTTITEDRLWQLLAKPVFRWRNSSGLSMNAAKAV